MTGEDWDSERSFRSIIASSQDVSSWGIEWDEVFRVEPSVLGESEWVLVEAEDGESVRGIELWGGPETAAIDSRVGSCVRGAYALGLSLPVGPLPSAGLLAGGRCRAARRVSFSSSSSATRCSKACRDAKREFNSGPELWGLRRCGVLTSRWAARLALNALCTSLARFGGRLSFLLRPRLEDIGGVADEIKEVDVEVVVRGGTWKSEGVEGRRWLIAADRYRHTADAGSVIESFFLACRSGNVSGPELFVASMTRHVAT